MQKQIEVFFFPTSGSWINLVAIDLEVIQTKI